MYVIEKEKLPAVFVRDEKPLVRVWRNPLLNLAVSWE